MTAIKTLLLTCFFSTATAFGADQATVRIEPTQLESPRPLERQTEAAIVRDYLQAWHSLGVALDRNQADLLDADFVGAAKEKLTATIQEQTKLGLHAYYQDRAHDIKIAFYSPEGLSVQLVDNVEYDVRILDHEKLLTTQKERVHYVAILTPSEVRWRVRVFQAVPE
jgi:hypothetical protein